MRIRRNFSKKFTAFRRADKSSASTNSIRISVALCVSLTHFGLNLSQSRSPAQFLPQRRGLCFRRCAGQQLLIDGAVFFLQECRRAAILQTVQQDPQLLLVAEGRADEAQAVFKRAECVLPVLLRRCSGAFGQKPHRVKCLRV